MKDNKKLSELLFKDQVIKNSTFFYYLCLLIIIVMAFIYGLSFTTMNDGFWHIKVGEYILKNKTIPHYDIFSWYGKSQHLSWINHEWLFGIIAYLVYSIDGFFSVSIFMGIISVLIALLLNKLVLIRTKNKWIALFCTSFYILILNHGFSVMYRPIMISCVIILIVNILFEKEKYLWALAMTIVGINVHGGIYPVYIMLFGYYTILKKSKWFFACLSGILVNPYTYNLYIYTYKTMKELQLNKKFISEWHTVALFDYKIPLIIIVITALTYALTRLNLREIIFSGAFILLSISSYRQLVFLVIVVLPMVAPYINSAIDELLNNYVFKFKLFQINKLFRIEKSVFLKSSSSIIILVILSFSNVKYCYNFFDNGMNIFKVEAATNPIYAVDYINKHPEIKSSKLFSHYNDSQYLIFRGIPTFVDSREDLFDPEFNSNTTVLYDVILHIIDGYNPQALITKYKINYILINKSYSIYNTFKSYKNLGIIYQDKNYCIFKVNYYVK
ncbi:hypothetical protein SAMN02745134_02167 [Clostridium acidisoli DSM 12555]|uniref:Dolichyl-phosphate-mannose-protein mannosyltransferase n=1 Tax=Clostridium acidisoli DSM 12555 TaxID=1121291 RepID=A0A1W1XKU2_9CLOT|nr:hypothetical protein [Clostridium acidisoli]SMC24427.1 hypothetical protein SAMN02745134_02167 [Clostridium acidisoli DSM 12555]